MPSPGLRLIDAFLSGDTQSAVALVARDATFHSPIRDYAGSEQIATVWNAVAGIVQSARPISVHERGSETIAFFKGAIKAQPVDGVLRTLTDEADRVTDIMLMVRPWAALRSAIADIKL